MLYETLISTHRLSQLKKKKSTKRVLINVLLAGVVTANGEAKYAGLFASIRNITFKGGKHGAI